MFAVSLSGNGDLLSQWRAYGGGGAGCAIGLDTDVLADLHGLNCGEVSYDSGAVRDAIETRLRTLVEELEAVGVPEQEHRVDRAIELADEIALTALGAKHPAFADEREM